MKVLFFAVALFLSAGAGAAGGGPRSCRADSELVRFVGRAAGDAAGDRLALLDHVRQPVVRLERQPFFVPFRRYGLLDARFGHRV